MLYVTINTCPLTIFPGINLSLLPLFFNIMELFNKVSDLSNAIAEKKKTGKTIGFVPTMGALHAGHLSLLENAQKENDITVVSIFVNPTQFNDPDDLRNYPRTPDKDLALLSAAGCNFVFMPSVDEIYPPTYHFSYTIGPLEEKMEGKFRPGHFQGVVKVVYRLFEIVSPHRAYFGEKDYQQLAIIRKMVSDLHLPVEIIPCPIVRESDGLAMSSRNLRLSPVHRQHAPLIAQTLFRAAEKGRSLSPRNLENWVIETINNDPFLRTEYFAIVDPDTLEQIEDWIPSKAAVGCIAVWAGEIRLIDNIRFLP